MCLSMVSRKFKKPVHNKVFAGYKVVRLIAGQYTALRGGPRFSAGEWQEARGGGIYYSALRSYPAGFHAFLTPRAAREYGRETTDAVVVKVLLKGVHTMGWQEHAAYVAKWQKVVEEVK